MPCRRRPRLPANLVVAVVGLVCALGAGPASACDPVRLEAVLDEADGQMVFVLRAEELEGARVHLRRLAGLLTEAEAQFLSCTCPRALAEVANAITEARRAAAATDLDDLAMSIDAAGEALQLTAMALGEDLCR
jgi:hypothetical protein